MLKRLEIVLFSRRARSEGLITPAGAGKKEEREGQEEWEERDETTKGKEAPVD